MATWAEMGERQRDAWLAEKLGWSIEGKEDDFFPRYTTDLTAAMGLLLELRSKEYHFSIGDMALLSDTRFCVDVWHETQGDDIKTIKAKTLPLAIAHAAWRALGGE